MKFLADENVEWPIVVYLREEGHDVLAAGIVLMRFANESSEQKVKGIEHLLKFHSKKLDKHFTVINEDQIKIRPIT